MGLNFSIAGGLLFILGVLVYLGTGPVGKFFGLLIPLGIMFALLFLGLLSKLINKPQMMDIFLLPIILLAEAIGIFAVGIYAFKEVSFLSLIVAGVFTDVLLMIGGTLELTAILYIPISMISSIVVFFLVSGIVGGLPGFVLGSLAGFMAFIPGHIPFLVTIVFFAIYSAVHIFL